MGRLRGKLPNLEDLTVGENDTLAKLQQQKRTTPNIWRCSAGFYGGVAPLASAVSLPSFALSAFVPVPLLQSAMPANEHQHKAIIQPSPPPPIKRRCRGCQLMQSFIEDAEIIVDGDESHRTGDEPRIHFRHSLWDVHTYIGAQTSPPPIPHPPTSR